MDIRFLPVLLLCLIPRMSAQSSVQQLSANNDEFTKKFYNIVRTQPGNIFFSPISIEIALAMLNAGAGGNSAEQIRSVTNIDPDKSVAAQNFHQLITALNDLNSNVTLNIANAVYVQKDFPIEQQFMGTLAKDFDAEAKDIDFMESTAVDTVNKWVSDKTNAKIPKLFDSLDTATKLVLLNAIYFKGNWLNKFDEAKTKKDTFHLSAKEQVEVDFMTISRKYRHSFDADLNADIVQLPYEGKNVSLVIVVPKDVDGLQIVEDKLQSRELRKLTEQLYEREVNLKLPKFKLEQTHDLNNILIALGITDIFTPAADLSGISKEPLYVSKAVQKAYIEVNEKGSEAAAATGSRIALRMMPAKPKDVTADRPFLFFLQTEQEPFLFLFEGRVVAPQ